MVYFFSFLRSIFSQFINMTAMATTKAAIAADANAINRFWFLVKPDILIKSIRSLPFL